MTTKHWLQDFLRKEERSRRCHHGANNMNITMTATLRESAYGNPLPSIDVAFHGGSTFRKEKAALYRIAATAEEMTVPQDQWAVVVDHLRVSLELATCSKTEVGRAMTLLRAVIDEIERNGL